MENNYRLFTGPMEASKAFNHLRGIVVGITVDHKLNETEVGEIDRWIDRFPNLRNRDPYKDIIDTLIGSMTVGSIDKEAINDMLWLCDNMAETGYYVGDTEDLQRLQGFCHGILADGKVTDEEVQGLQSWTQDHEHLQGYWPFDELISLITNVTADGIIDDEERAALKRFFLEFVELTDQQLTRKIKSDTDGITVNGICATDPQISLDGKTFVMTGKLTNYTRSEMKEIIKSHGGKVSSTISGKTDYVLVGADGNQCWAYHCYGRKIEEAIQRRKDGQQVVILHEYDFYDWLMSQE